MFALLLTTSDHVITYRKKKVNPIFDTASKIELWFHHKNFCQEKWSNCTNWQSNFDVLKEKSFR